MWGIMGREVRIWVVQEQLMTVTGYYITTRPIVHWVSLHHEQLIVK